MKITKCLMILFCVVLTACTTGKLLYVNADGKEVLACDVEFVGSPSVDKFAVEYALSLCAKHIVKKGYNITDTHLLDIDTTIPDPPCGKMWTHSIAKQQYKEGLISKKEYGYLVAHIDLELAVLRTCN